ncbi:MAG: ankyrin repeat domain-containing protein [Treponema sp.]
MAKKRITLPADFDELSDKGNIEELKAVFTKCELNAYDRGFKKPALSFYGIPLELMRWLIEQGADIEAKDLYGRTPLFYHAQVNDTERVTFLLEKGADILAKDRYGNTPLHFAEYHVETAELLLKAGADPLAENESGQNVLERMLTRTADMDIKYAAKAAELYLNAGCKVTETAQEAVTHIGEEFEFHRADFNPAYLGEAEKSLQKLYELFGVPPVPRRVVNDGTTPIRLSGESWQKRFEQAWDMLVPGSGKAATVQGEAVRVAGRIRDELFRNGGCNWDKDFRKMLNAFPKYVLQGNPLNAALLAEIEQIKKDILDDDDLADRLAELAVLWVMQNPEPIKLEKTDYDR